MKYKIILFILKSVSHLPFGMLYAISDVICFLLYNVAGYRTKVVRKNLSSSFPEKSEKELREIERKFYHWLCDYFLETLKLLTITPEEIKKRMVWSGMEHLYDAYDRRQNISVFLGHYCNWEWLSSIGLFYEDEYKDVVNGMIYHGLRSDMADDIMLEARGHLGGTCINKRKILRTLVTLKKENKRCLMGYIFDQGPKFENIHLWMDFLHHDTPVFTGAERLARKFNDKVVYLKMTRPKRGYYNVEFIPVTATPNEEAEFDITRKCMNLLEQSIRETSHLYLWTHNRWKRTHEDYNRWLEDKDNR